MYTLLLRRLWSKPRRWRRLRASEPAEPDTCCCTPPARPKARDSNTSRYPLPSVCCVDAAVPRACRRAPVLGLGFLCRIAELSGAVSLPRPVAPRHSACVLASLLGGRGSVAPHACAL
jgi:hypothetical protein